MAIKNVLTEIHCWQKTEVLPGIQTRPAQRECRRSTTFAAITAIADQYLPSLFAFKRLIL